MSSSPYVPYVSLFLCPHALCPHVPHVPVPLATPSPAPSPPLSPRYEEEINHRTEKENEFVLLKKVRVGGGWGVSWVWWGQHWGGGG